MPPHARQPRLPRERAFRCRGVYRGRPDVLKVQAQDEVSAGLLWLAGGGVALWAALIVFAGVLGFRGVLGVPVLGPPQSGIYGGASAVVYAFCSAAAALVATSLLLVLVTVATRGVQVYLWIVGFTTVVAALVPIAVEPRLDVAFAVMIINLAVGGAIASLAAVAGVVTVRRHRFGRLRRS